MDNDSLISARPTAPTVDEIQEWTVHHIAKLTGLQPEEIDVRLEFAHYGLKSTEAVNLIGDLEAWLKRDLPPTLPWDYPTIKDLAIHLAGC